MPAKRQLHSKVPLVAVECQYIYNLGLEDQYKCFKELSDEEWRYCKDHRESGPAQYRALTNGQYVEDHRKIYKDDEDYRCRRKMEQFRVRHGLTKPKLRAFFDHTGALQEEYLCKDDFHEGALDDVILSAAITTRKRALSLRNKLKRQQPVYSDRVTDRLIIYAEELQRHSGTIISRPAFTAIFRQAKEVLALWREKQEIPGFIYALFVTVELNRLTFLAMPHHRRFLDNAHQWLAATEDVCDQALNRCTGTHKQTVSFLAFYVPLLKGVLAFNGGEPEQAKNSLPSLHRLAKTIADDYGITPGTVAIRFAYVTYLAQFAMRFNKIDSAYQYLKEAEQLCSILQWTSIQAQLEVASVKAALGLMSDDENRYKYLQEYIVLFQHCPFLTHYNSLQELQRRYPKAVDASLFKGIPLYFDTMFRHLHPFLLSV